MFEATPEALEIVRRALAEDIGPGDITTELTVPAGLMASGVFLAKQDFTLAGIELLPLIYSEVIYSESGGADVTLLKKSGDRITKGDHLATVRSQAAVLLRAERVALNFLQRFSGVALQASLHAKELEGSRTRVLDTRKTTPGLRTFEKMAAAAGGATNHRKGLYDAVLIKNNHVTAAGGVRAALERASSYSGDVEIEVRTKAELEEALSSGAKHLLLDNLSPEEAREWVQIVNGRATTELSGNINLSNIRFYAGAGADFISCGAITHSAVAVDISFRLELES